MTEVSFALGQFPLIPFSALSVGIGQPQLRLVEPGGFDRELLDVDLSDLERHSGAAIAGQRMAIATIMGNGSRWALDHRSSSVFELDGRTQLHMLNLRSGLEDFAHRCGIVRCLLRASQENGPYSARGTAFKFESALQLCDSLIVDLVSPNSIRLVEEAASRILDDGPPWAKPAWRAAARQAVAAAIVASQSGGSLDFEEAANA